MKNNKSGKVLYLTGISVIAALGGFLFGYDTAIISGTLSFVQSQFSLDALAEGWYVGSALVGCIGGVLVAGILSDKYGRKTTLLFSAMLFLISAIGCAIAPSHIMLINARLVGGIGVGIASMLSPLYIAEISPYNIRGRMVALYQFAITIGILAAYFSNSLLLDISKNESGVFHGIFKLVFIDEVWRGMLGSETIPALLFFILLLFVPESPRWLVVNDKVERANKIIIRINGREKAKTIIENIKQIVAEDKVPFISIIREKGFRKALIIGIVLAILSQFSGINAIIYYGPRILNSAGLNIGDALNSQVIIGLVNVLFTIIAIWQIDKFGRRPLLIAGVTGIIIFLIIIGILFFLDITGGIALMIFILLYIACFAFSYGPVIWVFLSEIYPTHIRGRAMSLATLSLWIGTWFVGQMTPFFLENLKPYGTFWLFAVLTLPALYIAVKIMPETKGKTLEEIEKSWKKS